MLAGEQGSAILNWEEAQSKQGILRRVRRTHSLFNQNLHGGRFVERKGKKE